MCGLCLFMIKLRVRLALEKLPYLAGTYTGPGGWQSLQSTGHVGIFSCRGPYLKKTEFVTYKLFNVQKHAFVQLYYLIDLLSTLFFM